MELITNEDDNILSRGVFMRGFDFVQNLKYLDNEVDL